MDLRLCNLNYLRQLVKLEDVLNVRQREEVNQSPPPGKVLYILDGEFINKPPENLGLGRAMYKEVVRLSFIPFSSILGLLTPV